MSRTRRRYASASRRSSCASCSVPRHRRTSPFLLVDAALLFYPAKHVSALPDVLSHRFNLGDIITHVTSGMQAIVHDEFSDCFEQKFQRPWNWTWYLLPLWVCGIGVRYGILLPVRLMILIVGWLVFAIGFFLCVVRSRARCAVFCACV